MIHLKTLLERTEPPGDYYQLLGKPCLLPHRAELLEAIRAATRFLLPYQNHKNKEMVARARRLQLLSARADETFSDSETWRAYEAKILQTLREEYRRQRVTSGKSTAESDPRHWLREVRGVAEERLDEATQFVTQPDQDREHWSVELPPADTNNAAQAVGTPPMLSPGSARQPLPKTEIFIPHEPPFRLGSYEVLERLGEGGIGIVYKARHSQLQKLFAIKLLRRDRPLEPKAIARFHREVQAIGQLDHPNIVQATDAGEFQGAQFLVMELVDGLTLHDIVQSRGPLPIAQACDWIRQAALGLQHAHERGLIHRDVKPSNLMATKDNVIKVLDLGLAMLNSSEPERDTAEGEDRQRPVFAAWTELTVAGAILGTIDYMAPEQISDRRNVDARTDIYSLGCTLCYLLTGRAPFQHVSSDPLQRMAAHANAPLPKLSALRPETPTALEDLLQRMLAKSPRDRFQTTAAVARALEEVLKPAAPPNDSMIPDWVLTQKDQTVPLLSEPEPPRAAVCTPTPSPPVEVQPSNRQQTRPTSGTKKSTSFSKRPSVPPPPPGVATRLSGRHPILTMNPSEASAKSGRSFDRRRGQQSNTIIWWVTGAVLAVSVLGAVWLLASGWANATRKPSRTTEAGEQRQNSEPRSSTDSSPPTSPTDKKRNRNYLPMQPKL